MFIVIGGVDGQTDAKLITTEELRILIEDAVEKQIQQCLQKTQSAGKLDEILRYPQVLKILRISQPTLTKLVRSGKLRVVELGLRKRGVLHSELKRYMNSENVRT
ncbi:MAG: helix-turn-helix domain-containing protein [Ignavibacteria bacterium]|nr:helix-turn-helix domain-containing protein [Ignavibacteria bacterium]MBK9181770.1 helix-turn-helix domain-containing protein [Ignavibacteria bacterium]MBL0323243.1 helix-turn-helix domain-containing protein [Ignavibacteria bacterium]